MANAKFGQGTQQQINKLKLCGSPRNGEIRVELYSEKNTMLPPKPLRYPFRALLGAIKLALPWLNNNPTTVTSSLQARSHILTQARALKNG
jgi:hypothetical protein